MIVTVVVNRIDEVVPRQTTAMLIFKLIQRGHDVRVAEVGAFGDAALRDTRASKIVSLPIRDSLIPATVRDVSDYLKNGSRRTDCLALGNLLLLRTNPGRDPKRQALHEQSLLFAKSAMEHGTVVVNRPTHLWRLADKRSVLELDEPFRPASIVSRDPDEIESFMAAHGECVVKPLIGSRGTGVIRVNKSTSGWMRELQLATATGQVMVQEYLPGREPGDLRVVVVDGEILELNGNAAAIRRIPARGEFRANIHAGGTPAPAQLDAGMRAAARHAAAVLAARGVWLAGVDLIDDKIIEMNVFSTGGLYDAERFTGQDYCGEIAARLERLVLAGS